MGAGGEGRRWELKGRVGAGGEGGDWSWRGGGRRWEL